MWSPSCAYLLKSLGFIVHKCKPRALGSILFIQVNRLNSVLSQWEHTEPQNYPLLQIYSTIQMYQWNHWPKRYCKGAKWKTSVRKAKGKISISGMTDGKIQHSVTYKTCAKIRASSESTQISIWSISSSIYTTSYLKLPDKRLKAKQTLLPQCIQSSPSKNRGQHGHNPPESLTKTSTGSHPQLQVCTNQVANRGAGSKPHKLRE